MQLILALLACLQPPQIFNATGVYSQEKAPRVFAATSTAEPKPAPVVPAVKKMVVRKSTAAFYCPPCRQLDADIAAGLFPGIEFVDDPGFSTSAFPYMRFQDDKGNWVGFSGYNINIRQYLLDRSKERMTTQPATKAAVSASVPHAPAQRVLTPPVRYIEWDGYGTIDLETYSKNCKCPMCVSIRAMQQKYWQDLKAYQDANPASVQVLPAGQQPCPHETVEAMLDALHLVPGDTLADLGCGDGRVVIAAARRGIPAIGVEIDPERAAVARQAVKDAGVSNLVTIETGDAKDFDASRATVITAYLYPTLLEALAPKLQSVRAAASPYHQVPGLPMQQIGDIWLYTNATAREPPGDILTVTPDAGKTTTQLRRTQNPGRFQFVP